MFLPSSECGVDSNQVLRFLLCTVVAALAVTEPALNGQVGSQPSANPRGNLHATALKASYRESSGHELLVGQIHLQALSLTAGDFNNDGYPDLVAGYGTAGGTGRLLIHLANTEAFSPQLQDSLSAIRMGRFPPPFAIDASAVAVNAAPDLIASGDFNRDGNADIIFASQGAKEFYFLAGDGTGHFDRPRPVAVSGAISALVAGRLSNIGHDSSIVIGVNTNPGSQVMIFKSGSLGPSAVSVYPFDDPITTLTIAKLEGDLSADVFILSGDRLFILHGNNTNTPFVTPEYRIEPLSLPFGVRELAVGRFGTSPGAAEAAILAADNSLWLLSRETRSDAMRESGAGRRQLQVAPVLGRNRSWHYSPMSGFKPLASSTRNPIRLMASRVSGALADDLIVLDTSSGQLTRLDAVSGPPGESRQLSISSSMKFERPVAVLPMRLNVMGTHGLIVLARSDPGIVALSPEPGVIYHVTTLADSQSGVCTAPSGNPLSSNCTTLRAAVIAANAHPGLDAIVFDVNGTITLTVSGDDDQAAQGDLDISDALTIIGNGASNTIVQGGPSASTGIDKVFSFNPLGMQPGFAASISGLTIQFGRNPVTGAANNEGGALDFDGGADDGAGSLSISNCQILQNSTTDGDGGGIAVFDGGTVTINNTTVSGNQSNTQRAGLYYIGVGGGLYVGPSYPFQSSVTITNSTFSNNSAATPGQNAQSGGGIYSQDIAINDLNLVIQYFTNSIVLHGVTISGNHAGGDGGGLFGTFSADQASLILGNSSGGHGGGAFGAATVTNSTLSGNSAISGGGGLYASGSGTTILNSRIIGNTSAQGAAAIDGDNSSGPAVSAANNWWGSNNTPVSFVNSSIIAFVPWLVMTSTAAPTSLYPGATSVLSASITSNSNNSSGFKAPDGTPVTFAGTLGTVNPLSGTLTSGMAASMYTAGSSAGTASASITIDNQLLSTSIAIVLPPAPALNSISPATGVQSGTVPVTLAGTNFVSGATVAVDNTGITVSSVSVVSSTQITATFAIATNAVVGAANVTVATSGGNSAPVPFTVVSAGETVSTPAMPTGPATGVSGTLYQFTASGSASSLAHTIQYSFNWGDGTSSGWTPNGVTSSFHTWNTPGTYTITVQARCATHTAVTSTVSVGLAVTITGESLSVPATPAGPAAGVTSTSYTYSSGGSVSSLGHQVQFQLSWGDGSLSPWLPAGTVSASHTWFGPGTYVVTAKTRCATDTQIRSDASAGFTVSVSADKTISPPSAPNGPVTGIVGTTYAYTTGGAASSTGSAVVYLFDWGDGTTSGWLAAGVTSAAHKWTSPGSYAVKAFAADATNLLIQSSASSVLSVSIQAP